MLIIKYNLYITILYINSKGTFLLYTRGFTIRGNSNNIVQIVIIKSANKIQGYYFLFILYKPYK